MSHYTPAQAQMCVVNTLRGYSPILPYMTPDGSIPEGLARDVTFRGLMSDEEFDKLLTCRNLERTTNAQGWKYVRATHGHKGSILNKLLHGKYVPYSGPYDIFCVSHTTRVGLGSVNSGRRFNILMTPERCENKGVKGFISILDAKAKGLTFWSQVGDRYGNKIFCFDIELSENFTRVEYVSDYSSPERIKKYQEGFVNRIKNVCGFDDEKAIEHIQKLIVTIDDDDENADETGESSESDDVLSEVLSTGMQIC